MKGIKKLFIAVIFGIVGIASLGALGLSTPQDVQAACGASTSSCKTCHEVQGADPVSKKGDWHSQHSFGDFCQACHLGVATETDKTKAHAGMIANPVTQPDQTCISCHPTDAAARAAKYGGTATPSGKSSAASPSASGTTTSTDNGSVTPSPAAAQVPPSANPNFDVLDFNQNGRLSLLAWAIILADVLALFVLAILLWKWKKGLWPWAYIKGKQKNVPFNSLPPEVQEVFTQLLEGDMETILILKSILEGHQGRQTLHLLTQLPETVLVKLQTMDENDLKLLISRVEQEKEKGGR
ncbi:hypothetical protein Desaci_3274 [Desulfosporosinus acidiphilus SJ4]|uniref:Uncharacterized protein n=1 Tax=Desulfosporosinus acidiphilus (strain DSM 22704 / JCM 16185 / SJ4) TaxID=646529 RepID=I4D8P6_DESAJ|nr:cytochrome c3 family protein [Desulfosporosinus acidiphilus]AFM42170.1 hypothetical protein Desaci_3274 [Desulfosporosinus acidiphilus SJ4]